MKLILETTKKNKRIEDLFFIFVLMKKYILIFLLAIFFNVTSFLSQGMESDDSFTIELGLPNSFVNKAFKSIMQGLVTVSPYYQYKLKNNLSFGAGLHYTYFAVNEFRVPSKVYGGMHTITGFVKLGHEKFWTDKIGTDFGVKLGYGQTIIATDALKENGVFYNRLNAPYVEPVAALVLVSDVASSFRFTVGYAFYGFSYRPWLIGVDSYLGYDVSELNKLSSFLTVGFGYTHYFNGKKSASGDWE
jgi:hypothetical protein